MSPSRDLAEVVVERGTVGARLHDLTFLAGRHLEGLSAARRDDLRWCLRDFAAKIAALDEEASALRGRLEAGAELEQRLAESERQAYDAERARLQREFDEGLEFMAERERWGLG